jgi:methylenetetrahydrofolate dehydrogenase (NADP+) / methenyltetrahydrofolate cyclohydrolase
VSAAGSVAQENKVGRAHIIDGVAIAGELRRRIGDAAALLRQERGIAAGLATVLVGDNSASQVYVRAKGRACASSGLAAFDIRLSAEVSQAQLINEVEKLNRDERVDGVLVQLPLPGHIDPERVIAAIDPEKDVDGFHQINVGRLWGGASTLVPCTPQGCLLLLRSVHDDFGGKEAVILGRSNIVGKPLAALLLSADCTVTVAHSRSGDGAAICRRGDILVAATGRPGMVKAGWVKPGATVIDVGINPVIGPDGNTRLVGDVDYAEVSPVAGAITPVPGGVGPMTIACLLRNTVLAACRRRDLPDPDI